MIGTLDSPGPVSLLTSIKPAVWDNTLSEGMASTDIVALRSVTSDSEKLVASSLGTTANTEQARSCANLLYIG